MKTILPILLLAIASLAQAARPTSIIFVIGDGMAPAYTSAYRYYQDDPATPDVDTTIFDEMLVGMARTYPNDMTVVTDSAASATALAAGIKTFNGAIGVDVNRQPVTTLLEKAKARRYQTAVLATSTVNHATPASFIAHVNSRQSYTSIADQFFDDRINGKIKFDLLMGGGRNYFARSDRNLVQEFQDEGYHYTTSLDDLDKLDRLPVLGLFAEEGLVPALNSEHPVRLADMTKTALRLLDKKPFFLLIEASQIDWCGHANDIACAMAEMHDLAETLKIAKAYVEKNRNTILVVTADHGTGGLSIGANNQYQWDVDVIKKIKATGSSLAASLMSDPANWQTEWQRLTGIELTQTEINKMQSLLEQTTALVGEDSTKTQLNVVRLSIVALSLEIISGRSHTGWTSLGHTGEDVQIFSFGKNSNKFKGNLNNTDIAIKLFEYLPKR
jgi:alkaline phosphatase